MKPKTSVPPHPETSVDSRKVASEIREHLNSVGYDLGIDTIPLIKQVIDVEYKRAALTDSRGAGEGEAAQYTEKDMVDFAAYYKCHKFPFEEENARSKMLEKWKMIRKQP